MITFIIALIFLILGYFTYGKLVENVFKPDDRPTPAFARFDGVDYVEMPTWKVFLIQLLNIAGTGPIFGALMGAVFGPIVFLWIVLGCILGGAVCDYLSGMISCRMGGASLSEITGRYLGKTMMSVMRVLSLILMILVGSVFVTSPAMLLAKLTPKSLNVAFWIVVILIYYLAATLLPIDKIIGRFYPIFSVVLLVMVISIIAAIFVGGYQIPELTLQNLHPTGKPVWSYMFVTVACGAISGFHATQSPMMARCMRSEKDGRKVFYGSMIAEGMIALVWAAVGSAFYGSTKLLNEVLTQFGPSDVVYSISTNLLGTVGGIMAIIGVVVCPITSGDTAFRSARLTISDWFGIEQKSFSKRFIITIPLLLVSAFLTQVDFNVIWRYTSWFNQTLAMISLWAFSVYLARNSHAKWGWLMPALPAIFMSAVSAIYILQSPEGFRLSETIAYPCGIVFALLCFALFFWSTIRTRKNDVNLAS